MNLCSDQIERIWYERSAYRPVAPSDQSAGDTRIFAGQKSDQGFSLLERIRYRKRA